MKINWQNASNQEQKLFEGISILTDHRRDLLEFLFDPKTPRLRKRAGIIREDSWLFSDGDRLIIQAALDFWSGAGHLALWECIEIWDNEEWTHFLAAVTVIKVIDLQKIRLKTERIDPGVKDNNRLP